MGKGERKVKVKEKRTSGEENKKITCTHKFQAFFFS